MDNEVDRDSSHVKGNGPGVCTPCTYGVGYCDSTWLQYENLNAALFGLDLPSLHPMPLDWLDEPGVRGQIFQATYREEDGSMNQYDYLETVNNLRCTASFEEYLFTNFEQTIDQWTKFTSSAYNLQLTPEVEVEGTYKGVTVGTTIPPLFTRGSSESNDVSAMERHFKSDEGSVAHTRAECAMYRVKVRKRIIPSKKIRMSLKFKLPTKC